MGKHIKELLDALIACFKDESWPVRDAASLSSGDFVSQFPQKTNDQDLHELYHLWFEHLSDNIQSVREDTAFSLAKVIKAMTATRREEDGVVDSEKIVSP